MRFKGHAGFKNYGLCLALCLITHTLGAQVAGAPISANERTFGQVGLPPEASILRAVLPGVFDRPGHVRLALTGTITSEGTTTPFSFTRELDQKVRLDLGAPVRSTIADGLATSSPKIQKISGDTGKPLDDDILETLSDDSVEAFLFSFGTEAQIRWMGGNYRTDDGNSMPYNGPLFDVFAKTGLTATRPEMHERTKSFFFDSKTRLLAFTRYQTQRNGTETEVEVAFEDWTLRAGLMVPTTITRTENGQMLFSISVQSANIAGSQADSIFGF